MLETHWSAWLAFGICGLVGILTIAFQWPWWIALASIIGFPALVVLLTAGFASRRRR